MGKILSFALETASRILDRVPVERIFVKPPDTTDDRKELMSILQPKLQEEAPERPARSGKLEPRRSRHVQPQQSTVSDQETVDYQDREIGKLLLRMERHYAQGLRINGKVCDCGASKHLLDLEGMSEETIPIADNPDVYSRLMDWVHKVGPLSTVESVASGEYDQMYPIFSQEARDFRKEIMGTLDPKALWPNSSASLADLVKRAGDVKVVSVEKVEEPRPLLEAHFEVVQPTTEPVVEEAPAAPAAPAEQGSEK